LTRLAFSNLATPARTLARTLDAVAGYGHDGLELRLLDGEPVDRSAVDGATSRILVRTQVPLVLLDTSRGRSRKKLRVA
jgi:hypothetical protein